MKILYHHRIASKDGQNVHIQEMIAAFKRAGHDVYIVEPKGFEEQEIGSQSSMIAFLKRYVPSFLYEILEFFYSFVAFIKLVGAYYKYRPDFLYERNNLFLFSGVLMKWVFRIPFVLEVNAPLFAERAKYDQIQLKRFTKGVENFIWRQSDLILPVTQCLGDIITRDIGYVHKGMHIIPNGVNLEEIETQLMQFELDKKVHSNSKVVLGFVGFIRKWHGLDRLFPIIKQYPNLELVVIGEGDELPFLKSFAQEMGIENQIQLKGLCNREEIFAQIHQFDIALQPKVVDYASPLKLFEYMALKKAIVAPRQKNIEEVLIDGQNALLFDSESDIDCQKKIEMLCNDAALRDRLGQAAYKSIVEVPYTWDHNAQRIIEIVKALK